MDSQCIICQRIHIDETVEHIIPSSLGNEYYVLPRGLVCSKCNNKIARLENRVLSSEPFINERSRLGNIVDRPEITPKPLRNEDMIKFVLKIGYEALFQSRKKIWRTYKWNHVNDILLNDKEVDVLSFKTNEAPKIFKAIPNLLDRFRLRNNYMSLDYGIDQFGWVSH